MAEGEKFINCANCGAQFRPVIIEGKLAKCPYCGYMNPIDS